MVRVACYHSLAVLVAALDDRAAAAREQDVSIHRYCAARTFASIAKVLTWPMNQQTGRAYVVAAMYATVCETRAAVNTLTAMV